MEYFDPVINFFWQGHWKSNFCEPRRMIYECELVFLSAGSFTLVVDGNKHKMKAPCLALIPPRVTHESYTDDGEEATRHCLHFDWLPLAKEIQSPIAAFEGDVYFNELEHPVPGTFSKYMPCVINPLPDEICQFLKSLFDLTQNGNMNGRLLLWPILKYVINELSRKSSKETANAATGQKTLRAILSVKDYIDTHYAEPVGYYDFCKLSGLSKSYLCHSFKQFIGFSPSIYLNNLRLQHACRLLRNSQMNIAEVAEAVGIEDQNYFSRLFRRRYHVSPSEFIIDKK